MKRFGRAGLISEEALPLWLSFKGKHYAEILSAFSSGQMVKRFGRGGVKLKKEALRPEE